MKQDQKGLTLIETMMMLAAIGILATIAIPPAYQLYGDSEAREQVTEALGLLQEAQASTAVFHENQGRWPTPTEFEALVTQRTSRYVAHLTPAALPAGYQITATFKTEGVNAALQDERAGRTLVVATRDGTRWICNDSTDPGTGVPGLTAGTVLPQHRPPLCK